MVARRAGKAECLEEGEHRDRVGGRDHGAEQQRRAPRESQAVVQDHADNAGREHHPGHRQHENGEQVPAQLVQLEVPGRFKQQRGQEDQQDQVWRYVDHGQEMHRADDQADDHQRQRIGYPHPLRGHGHGGGDEQQQDKNPNSDLGFRHQ